MAASPRGAEGGHAACRRRSFRGRAARGGLWDYLQVGVRAGVLLWEVSFAASESQRPDDLVCRVQRRRPAACFAWGRRFCHCCVPVPKSSGWGVDFLWLVHVLCAWWGSGGGACTPAPQAGVRVFVWALGAPSAAHVAWVAPLRGASEARLSPSSGCPPPGGLPGSASHVLWARVCGFGGPTLSPWPACPVGAACCGGGGGPSTSPTAWCTCEPPLRTMGAAEGRLWLPSALVECVRAQALPLPRLAFWAGCRGPLPACCCCVCASVGAQHCPLGSHAPLGAASRGDGQGPSPGRAGLPALRGASGVRRSPSPCRPSSGMGGRGSATRVSWVRLVWAWEPSTSPTPCEPLMRAVGAAEGRPRGGAFHRCQGRLSSGTSHPLAARPLGGFWGPLPMCCGRWCAGEGVQHCPLGLHAPWGLRAAGVVANRPRGGWRATVVSVLWCQALSLPQPPVLWGGSRGSATHVSRVRLVRVWGPCNVPTACAPGGQRCALPEWRKGVPRKGAFRRCEGCLRSGAPPPLAARPLGGLSGSATHLLWARVCGFWGPSTVPWVCMPFGGCVLRGWCGAVSGGAGLPLL